MIVRYVFQDLKTVSLYHKPQRWAGQVYACRMSMDQCDKQTLLSGPALWPLTDTEAGRFILWRALWRYFTTLTRVRAPQRSAFWVTRTWSPPHVEKGSAQSCSSPPSHIPHKMDIAKTSFFFLWMKSSELHRSWLKMGRFEQVKYTFNNLC